MRRQRRDIEVQLLGDVAAAERALNEHAEWTQAVGRRKRGNGTIPGLSVRVRDDGRMRARIAESGVFGAPPRLVGRITDGPNGVVLNATIKESGTRCQFPAVSWGWRCSCWCSGYCR